MTYKKFLHHKFMNEHGGVLDDELPDTYDLWEESLTVEQKKKFQNDWVGLETGMTEEVEGKTPLSVEPTQSSQGA